MRTFLVLSLIVFISQVGFGQQDQSTFEVFEIAEVQPEFEGGIQGFYTYIVKNLRYPGDARELGIEGKVIVQFVIDEQGSIPSESVKLFRGVHSSLDEEAMRLIRESPNWTPGRTSKNGPTTKVRMVLPITFKLGPKPKEKKKKNKKKD